MNGDRTGVEKLQRLFESETGLQLVWINSGQQLGAALDRGLRNLYKTAFGGAPYFESFSDKEVDDIFRDYVDSKGRLLVAQNAEGVPVAFTVSTPLAAHFNDLAAVARGCDPRTTAYVADTAVDASRRHQGLAVKLKKILLEENIAAGVKKIFSRTSAENYRQISASNKAGASYIRGAFQFVSRKRTDGTTYNDRSIFFVYDTARYAEVSARSETLPDVMILREGDRDVARVRTPVPQERRPSLSARIREAYPGLASVAFETENPSDGAGAKVLFNGAMYLPGETIPPPASHP